jgi:hypothetical protein
MNVCVWKGICERQRLESDSGFCWAQDVKSIKHQANWRPICAGHWGHSIQGYKHLHQWLHPGYRGFIQKSSGGWDTSITMWHLYHLFIEPKPKFGTSLYFLHTHIYIEYIIIHSYINIVLYIHHIQIHEFLFLGVKGGAQPELPTARCLLLGSEWPSYARARARGPWSVLGMAWYTISKWLVYGWWISFKKGIGLFFLMASYLTST